MSDQDPTNPKDPDFDGPSESEGDEKAEVFQLPVIEATSEVDETDEPGDEDGTHWSSKADGPSSVDDFTSEEYVSATTQEYQGLAEDVSKAATEKWEMQAVAATLPGVDSGLVGFEDVGGVATSSEESYEAVEQAASSDLTMRIGSGIAIFGFFLGSLLLGGWWFSAFVTLVMVVSVGELYANLRTRGYRPFAFLGILGVVMMGVGAHNWGVSAIGGWGALAIAATLLFYSITPRDNPLENTSVTILGMAWIGLLSFAILIAAGPHPVAYIVFLALLVAFNDIGAYFVGSSFGKRKLAPTVSPNKTIEGFVGGLITGAVASSVLISFPAWSNIGLAKGLVFALVIGMFAPLGDLAESMVKRAIGVKDMGSVLPGHGGMLDRIDGFLFAVPAVYVLFRAFGLL